MSNNNNMATQNTSSFLLRDESGSIITDSEGNWLIMNPHDNTIESIAPMMNLVQPAAVSLPSCSKSSELIEAIPLKKFNDDIDINDSFADTSCEDTQKPNKARDHQEHHQWSRKAILLLITLYKEHQKQFRDTSIKNEKVWGMIQDQLRTNGFTYSKTQIENKFKYLKARYLKKKDNEGSKGTGEPPISFDYYEEFEDIFGKHPNVTPTSSASSLQGCSSTSVANDSDSEPPQKKTRLEKQIHQLQEIFEKQNEDKEKARQQRHKERLSTMERAIDVYQNTMEQFMNKFFPK